jgi:threonine aldolase
MPGQDQTSAPCPERIVDLRSDTVSVPTAGMLEAMMSAQVGDDVYGEDPTANRLEAMVAEMCGKEAAIFVTSGTMGNLLSIRALTQPGDEVILEADSHTYNWETGGYAALAGVSVRFIQAERGIIQPEQIAPATRPQDLHSARTSLVVLENTHNRGGGSVYPVQTVEAIAGACREQGLRLHMDGARLFDACVAAGCEPVDYARHVDSVTFCLSKSLGCPAGSMIAGEREFIDNVRWLRHMFGGAMRQVGYLAGAGIYALENNIERLAEDHENARRLADGARGIRGLRPIYDPPETNMVYFDVLPPDTPSDLCRRLREVGVLVGGPEGNPVRAVTHIGITADDIDHTVAALQAQSG